MNQRATPLRGLLAALAGGLLSLSPAAFAASPTPLTGEILGQVKNAAGIAQMGAAVYLYNRYDESVRRALSNEQGRFAFDSLVPGLYSVRVLLASFVPAERRNIAVLPSTENRLNINLASVFSTVDLVTFPASAGTLMTDDWKWVLRTSQSTRPVLRLLPDFGPQPSTSNRASSSNHPASAFSETTGVLKLSAGEGDSFTAGAQQDLGTAFALATSLAGGGRIKLDGNLGYANASPLPAVGLRTTYTHSTGNGSNPEFVLTGRQIYLAPRTGEGASPLALRTLSAAFLDRLEITDRVTIDYGFDYASVSYIHQASTVSPFLRAAYDGGRWGRLRVGLSAGGHATELLARDLEKNGGLDQDLVALASLPQVSRSNGDLTMQHTEDAEISWERIAGSRTYTVGAFAESVSNASFMLSAPATFVPAADLLPDLNSTSSIFNVGSYRRVGYTAAVKQALGDRAEVTVAAGRTGALMLAKDGAPFSNSEDLRAGLHQSPRNWVTVRVAATIPGSGTHVAANYGWTDFRVLMPAHFFVTQTANQAIGVNVFIRQPLPNAGLPWRMEAIAELRNLLAQGYLPIGDSADRNILTNAPRALRGGLNFIF